MPDSLLPDPPMGCKIEGEKCSRRSWIYSLGRLGGGGGGGWRLRSRNIKYKSTLAGAKFIIEIFQCFNNFQCVIFLQVNSHFHSCIADVPDLKTEIPTCVM